MISPEPMNSRLLISGLVRERKRKSRQELVRNWLLPITLYQKSGDYYRKRSIRDTTTCFVDKKILTWTTQKCITHTNSFEVLYPTGNPFLKMDHRFHLVI